MVLGKRQNSNSAAAARDDLLNGMGFGGGRIAVAVSASLVCHLIFFSVMVFMQTHESRRISAPSFISVKLVSLPGPKAAPKPGKVAAEAKKPEAPPPAKTESPKPPQKKVQVSDAPKEKVSLKQKTFKTEKVKKNVLEKLEKKVETNETERLAEAIEKLRDQVEKEEEDRSPPAETRAAGQPEAAADNAGDAGGRPADLIDIYRVEVAYQIQKNWAFPDQFAEGRSDLQTLLVFKILPSGQITDLFFTDRSGNKYFDESAYRAVMKSNPVAPHPQGVRESFIEMGLRFTPEGVN